MEATKKERKIIIIIQNTMEPGPFYGKISVILPMCKSMPKSSRQSDYMKTP